MKQKKTNKTRKTNPSNKRSKGVFNKGKKSAPKGRPKKYTPTQLAVKIKRANERLRKIEKVHKIADISQEYQLVKKYYEEYPNTKGRIYKPDTTGRGIRFISVSELNKIIEDMSPEKAAQFVHYYYSVIENFLASKTSTLKGVKEKTEKAYKTFMSNYGGEKTFSGLTIDQYVNFFKIYRDMVKSDKEDSYGYNMLAEALEYVDISRAMTDNQMKEVFTRIRNKKPIPIKYRNHKKGKK